MTMHSGRSFLLGGGMVLLAAVIFSGTIIWNDTHAPQGPTTSANSAPASVPPLPAGAPNPALNAQRHFPTEASGKVVQVQNDRLVIDTVSPQAAFLGGQASTTPLTVLFDSGTTIYKQGAKKSAAEYQKEMQTFLHDIAYATNTAVQYQAPDYYAHIALSPSDITPGTFVLVYSSQKIQQGTLHADMIQARF